MMTVARTPEGLDVFNAVTALLMEAQHATMAIAKASQKRTLPANDEFSTFCTQFRAACEAWRDYLDADLRATILQPESKVN